MENQEPTINQKEVKTGTSILYLFFKFTKSPKYDAHLVKKRVLKIISEIIKLLSFGIVIAIVLSLFASFVASYFDYDQSQNSVFDLFKQMPIYVILLLTVLWAPITEELAFRMGMKYSKVKFSFSLALLFGVIFEIFISYSQIAEEFITKITFIHGILFSIILFFLISFAVGLSILFILEKYDLDAKIESFYAKHFSTIFYFLTITFALVHVLNYYNIKNIWFITPLFVIPQFIIGLILGYIRVHYGLQWSMFTHFLYNGVLTVPLLFFSNIDKGKFLESEDVTAIESLSSFDQGLFLIGTGLGMLFIIIILVFFIVSIFEYYKYRKNKTV